jgi:ketol-acid reductoisomerase
MDYKGVSFMVDNCSTTARLGARKWASRFDYILKQQTFPSADADTVVDETPFDKFMSSNIHEVLKVCAELRPSVDIAVVPSRRD